MGYSPPTKTGADVKRQVQRQFGDESGVQLEDADIIMWVNDAQDAIVAANHPLKSKTSSASIVGQYEYTYPAVGIDQIESIHYDGSFLPNKVFSQAEIDIFSADPQRVISGAPQYWYEWGGTFGFWPTPDIAKPIAIYFSAQATKITALTATGVAGVDLLSTPDEYFRAIVQYVLQQAYEMDEDANMSGLKASQFSEGIAAMSDDERMAQNMTYPVIGIREL
jgi:hypothetical protein